MKTKTYKYIITRVLLFSLLSFVVASCAQAQPKQAKEVSISWSEIAQGVGLEVGDVLEVVLPAKPSTGYVWEAGFYNQSVLKPNGEPEFYKTDKDLGSEETQKMHFEAIDEGETELVLVYRRSFENEAAGEQTFQINVVVK